MRKRKSIQKLTAMMLFVIMVVGMMPVSALAETGSFPIGASGEVTAFEALGSEIAVQNVPLGTSETDLELPDSLTATVRLAASEEDPVLDSREVSAEPDGANPVSDPAITIGEMDEPQTGGSDEDEIASPSDSAKEDNSEVELIENDGGEAEEITILLPVTWASSPEYNDEAAGTYVFTPKLPEGLALMDDVEAPQITVTVDPVAITGTVTAFDELPDDIRWQNTTAPEFPETVGGIVTSKAVQIPATWEADHNYDTDSPIQGLYVFTAVLGEGYALADGVELPRMTVYIPQTVDGMMVRMARMAGDGTTNSPLEITTAAQLAEIATLVNARENGLELFLFNDADVHITLELHNDIDLSVYTKGESWVPIGSVSNQFKGTFDGGGNRITGLYINRNEHLQGLFGCVGSGGTIRNIGVENVNITGGNYVGGVAGYSNGIAENCYITGTISGAIGIGGVVGHVYSGTVQNCYSIGTVSGTANVGGVVGAASEGTLINCYSTGDITGTNSIGGVMGYLSSGTVQNCAALNPSVSSTNKVGRVAGHTDGGTLSGNIALASMMVKQDGSAKTPIEGVDQVDGESKTVADIRAAGFFEVLFGNDTVWTYAEGNLPGFGAAIDMPAHIVDGNDSNFYGAGTSENPYQISTPAQLSKMAELVNNSDPNYNATNYKLMNDLDLSSYAAGEGWMPIGTYSNRFKGTFDGNGNKITNLTISRNSAEYQGLFGFVGSGGAVKNLGVTGVSVSGDSMVGGVVGFVETGIVQNCYSTGNVTALGFVGGVVAYADSNSIVQNCYSTCDVNSTDPTRNDSCAGGVAGLIRIGSKIQNCYSTGNVFRIDTGGYAGGVVGHVARGRMQDCYSTGNVSGSSYAGGVVGYLTGVDGDDLSASAVQNCYSTGTVSNINRVGGIAGQVCFATLKNCAALNPSVSGSSVVKRVTTDVVHSKGLLSGNLAFEGMEVLKNGNPQPITNDANALDGLSKTSIQIATSDFWTIAADFTENWNSDVWSIETGKLPILKNMGGQDSSMPAHLLPAGASLFEGAGTSENPYQISTATQLAKLAELVNTGDSSYNDKYYTLMNDLDLSAYGKAYDGGRGWIPIGRDMGKPFNGKFDGNDKTITGLVVNRPVTDNIGLFGYLYPSSKVHNLRIIGASILGNDYVGGAVGYAWGATVENCAVSGSISGAASVGSIVGYTSSGEVYRCYSTGSVTGTGNYVGGIVGYLENTASNLWFCYSDSSVSGSSAVGGVAGHVFQGKMQNCYSTGNVAGARYVGGVAGNVTSDTLQNCYSTGSVTGTDEYVGGIVGIFSGGTSGTMKNCVALNPSINVGEYNFGRMAGRISSGTLSNNYAFSRIPGTWENKGSGAKDGADITMQTLFTSSFWTAADNWDSASWDSGIWTFADGKLPLLQGLAGQNGDGGLYLTARDIQYATVSTAPLTYNGNEQIPTITFDDETLIKDTDYTVSFTSTDGSGTSSGTNSGTVTLTITGIGSFYGIKNLTYTIEKKPITITPNSGQSKKYGGVEPILIFANDGGLTPGAFTGKLTRAAGENVGTYAISLGSVSAGDNYELSLASSTVNFTIEQAKVQSITAIVDNINKTAYEMCSVATAQAVIDSLGLPSSVSVTTDGGTATLPITWSTATAYNIKGTEYAVIGTLTGNENIDVNSIIKSITVTVTPVTAVNPAFSDTLAVINSDSSATAAELGGTILPASGSITVEGVSVAYTINWNGGETLNRTAVGNEQTFTGAISYDSVPAWLTLPSDLTVSRKVTVMDKTLVTIGGITTPNKAYDGTFYAPTGMVICSHSFPTNQLEWLYESTDGLGYSSSTAPTNAGAYKLTISVPESNVNYAGSEMFTFTIEKRKITLAADHKLVIKGSSLPELTYTVVNLAFGKTKADALSSEPVLACPTFDGNTPGSYAITLIGGTAKDNYTITTRTNGILTVAQQTYTGGGGSSSDRSPIIVTLPAADNPNSPTQGEIKVPGTVDSEGNITVNITNKTVTDAFEKVLTHAKKNGNEQNGITLVLHVDAGSKTASNVTVYLPKAVQDTIITKKIVNIVIVVDNPDIKISIDLAAVTEINRQAKSDISITATRMNSGNLTGEAKKAIGSRPVFNLKMNYGSGKQVQSFGSGSVSVTIPYTLGANEKAGNVQAVYVDAKGKVHWLINSVYDSVEKELHFSTDHFSTYGIGYNQTNTALTDIADHWAKEDIEFVVSGGLFSGTSATIFSPNTTMTRGMFVTALGRLANTDVSGYKKSSFTDVKDDAYYMGYIEWASKNNIVNGIGNGKFAPDQSITREQMAVIMQSYTKAIGFTLPKVHVENTFADNTIISAYVKDAVKQMQMAGVISGKNGNKFDPQGTATRAEVSAVLKRFVELAINTDTAEGWTVNDSGKWMYYENGKAVTGKKNIDGTTYIFDQYGVTADVPKNRKYKTYTVQKGDNFWLIAYKQGCTIGELERLNNKSRFTLIHPGDVLRVPEE